MYPTPCKHIKNIEYFYWQNKKNEYNKRKYIKFLGGKYEKN